MDALRRHVRQTLCARDGLDAGQTPLHEAVIRRAGLPCGLFFQVRGPRLLTGYAVWAGPERRILFYDAAGERFGMPPPPSASASARRPAAGPMPCFVSAWPSCGARW
jgi:hypothetical protein